jgi:hypothetical protein
MARWNACNILSVTADSRHLWQFDGGSFRLNREQVSPPGQPVATKLVGKTWSSLWQKKLNVAWLPPEHVFIRVAHFPNSTPDETRAMVELQLEKLSPIPVTQAVWTMHAVPHPAGAMQTVIVLIVSRSVVEEFLDKLEGEGFLADRLELSVLDQLQATAVNEDGAWIYPEAPGGTNTALVAWWYGGVLQTVDLLTLSAETNRAAGLKDQLMQMAWAGELEGWLASPPKWHLVAEGAVAEDWLKPLQEGLEQPVEVVPPAPAQELAARTARRAAESDPKRTLLPVEYVTRYRQQFVDRLWMRWLGAVLALYVVGLIVYFVALGVLNHKTSGVEAQARGLAASYTNSMQLQAQLDILKERQELKFAALDCWLAVAEALPTSLTLDTLVLSGGNTLRLTGSGPADQVGEVIDFSDSLRKARVRGQLLFDQTRVDAPRPNVRGANMNWSFEVTLRRTGNR